MDRDLLARKLDSLERCLGRLQRKCPPSGEALSTDIDSQDILSVNLERAVQLCVDIGAHLLSHTGQPPPDTMGEVFVLLCRQGIIPEPVASAMRQAVGFRNLSVHAYDRVDWERVFAIVRHRLDDFRKFAAAVDSHAGLT